MLPELLKVVFRVHPTCDVLRKDMQAQHLTQFLLDRNSLNLPENCRVGAHNPDLGEIFSVSRNWCYAISRARSRSLQQRIKQLPVENNN